MKKGLKDDDVRGDFVNLQSMPSLMIEEELIEFLRIPHISNAGNHSNVVKNLIRMRDLPRIQICSRLLYPTKEVLEWISRETIRN